MGGDDNKSERGSDLHIGIPAPITKEEQTTIWRFLPRKIVNMVLTDMESQEPLQMRPHYVIPPNFPLFQAIQDWIVLHDKYERIPIKKSTLSYLQSTEFDHDVIHGEFAITDRYCHRKWVTQIPYTHTDYAMGYLALCQFTAGETLRRQYNKRKDICSLKPTNYYCERYQGELAYIDLKAAYWSMLWPTTIDMEYDPDQQEIVSEGRIPYIHCDQFAKWKPVRNVFNTLYNYRLMKIWSKEKRRLIHQFPPSATYRPYNYAYIMDMMNALATDVKNNFTLLQWLTDAAIVPAHQANALLEFLYEEWCLEGKLKYLGEGDSNAKDMYIIHGTHDLPYHATGHYNPQQNGDYFSSLRPANIDGLKSYRRDLIDGKIPLSPVKGKKLRISRMGRSLSTAKTYVKPDIPKRTRPSNERGWLTPEKMKNAIPIEREKKED
jgi:hypothetical protein